MGGNTGGLAPLECTLRAGLLQQLHSSRGISQWETSPGIPCHGWAGAAAALQTPATAPALRWLPSSSLCGSSGHGTVWVLVTK